MAKYTVWVPTGEMLAYTVEAHSEADAKQVLLNEIESGKQDWGVWEDAFYCDVSMCDWEVEKAE